MGFFEKVKNMFTEEVEDDDVKVEQVKGDVTKVSFEAPKKEEPEKEEELEETKKIDKIERDFEETKVNKPVFFDDDDFKDLSFGVKEEKEEEKVEEKKEEPVYRRTSYYEEVIKEEPKPTREIYGSKIEKEVVVEEKKIFKPTPIISPVYGILDKNYHKEDIVSRNEVRVEEKENPIDSVRNKAYGTLEDDLENTLFGTNSILFKKDEPKEEVTEVNDDILTNLTDDISKELDELLIKKEKFDYSDLDEEKKEEIVEEEKPKRTRRSTDDEEDLLDFIDSTLYKDGDEE